MRSKVENIGLIATAIILMLLVGNGRATAATFIQHIGDADPTTESPAWILTANSTSPGSGVTHLGEAAWKMTDTAGDLTLANYRYLPASNDFLDPTGWTVEWRMAGENLKTLAGDDEAVLRLSDGFYVMAFLLEVNGTGDGDGATLTQRFGATVLKTDIPTIGSRATGFHTFALDYDGTAGGLGVYRLFYDNTLVTDSVTTPGLVGFPGTAMILSWGGLGGNNSDARDVDSYWNLVRFRTGRVTPPAVAGDFDSDGDVDGADFVAWQTNFPKATGAVLSDGDADGDGDVDGADFVVWQTNFPFTPGPGITTVPEPTTILLGMLAGLAVAFRSGCSARLLQE